MLFVITWMTANMHMRWKVTLTEQKILMTGLMLFPVSDPNAATMSQRVMQYQAALQLAQQAPQLYDMGKLHRQMLRGAWNTRCQRYY